MSIRITTALSVALVFFVTAVALARTSSDEFKITKYTIDNGGGTSSNGDFSVTGTIGQPEANRQISTGGGFLLAGGFWAKAQDLIFKDNFESN